MRKRRVKTAKPDIEMKGQRWGRRVKRRRKREDRKYEEEDIAKYGWKEGKEMEEKQEGYMRGRL